MKFWFRHHILQTFAYVQSVSSLEMTVQYRKRHCLVFLLLKFWYIPLLNIVQLLLWYGATYSLNDSNQCNYWKQIVFVFKSQTYYWPRKLTINNREMTEHQAGNFPILIHTRQQSSVINWAQWHTYYSHSLSLLYNRVIACNLTAKLKRHTCRMT